MRFDWLTGWPGGGGKSGGASRRARLVVLPAVLFVAAGLAVAADPLAVAPPPREAKPAKVKVDPKLLVGKWRLVATGPQPLARGDSMVVEFAEDGAYRCETVTDRLPLQRDTGSYLVDGDTVRIQTNKPLVPEGRTWGWTVVSLTPDRLDLVGQGKQSHHKAYFARVAER